jgi:hypothetical protein
MKKLSRKTTDLVWFSVVALLALAFASVPFWTGQVSETNELRFRGTYFDEADYAVHISMMQAGRMGDWAYQMRFTDEEHRPAYLRLFYIFLGHVSKWIGLDVESTFHLARWFFGFIALHAIYQLFRKIFEKQNHARAAFLLAIFGAGMGWLQLILGAPLKPISPIDFWLIDAYVFFSVSLFPSFSFTLAAMVWALNLFFDFLETGNPRTVLVIGMLAVLSQAVNPISFVVVDMAIAGAVIASWGQTRKFEKRHIIALLSIALVQIPLLVYNFLILSRDPFWSQFTAQNQTFSPPPVFYFWGFAPFWLFALYGIYLALRDRNPRMLALACWVAGGLVLAYLPVPIQRRFILGITIPLAGLALHGLSNLLKQIPVLAKRENTIYLLYILLASISSIYLSLGLSLFLRALPDNKFYPRDVESALAWLDTHATPNDFVLADIPTSQLAAQRTRLRVYVGHEMETLRYEDKKQTMELFFARKTPNAWLSETKVKWVIANKTSLPATEGLDVKYENGSVVVYEVSP